MIQTGKKRFHILQPCIDDLATGGRRHKMLDKIAEIRQVLSQEECEALTNQAVGWYKQGRMSMAPLQPRFGRWRIDLADAAGRPLGIDAQGQPFHESLCVDLATLCQRVIRQFDLDPAKVAPHKCFFTMFLEGAVLPEHMDPPTDVIRFVFLIRKPEAGGLVKLAGQELPLSPGDCYALPLRLLHGVTKVESGVRIALAMGLRVAPDLHQRLTLAAPPTH